MRTRSATRTVGVGAARARLAGEPPTEVSAKVAELVPSFGRQEVPGRRLTDLGCPDCPGVLAAHTEGRKGHLTFVCRVGHVFAADTLIEAKEEALELALWN